MEFHLYIMNKVINIGIFHLDVKIFAANTIMELPERLQPVLMRSLVQ